MTATNQPLKTSKNPTNYLTTETLLAEVIKKCPSSSTLIIGGDINARVGNCDNWGDEGLMGKFGINSGTNERVFF